MKITVGKLKNLIQEAMQAGYGWVIRVGDQWIDDQGELTSDITQAAVYEKRRGPGNTADYVAETGDYDDAVVEPAPPKQSISQFYR